jgi:hypothetical protein
MTACPWMVAAVCAPSLTVVQGCSSALKSAGEAVQKGDLWQARQKLSREETIAREADACLPIDAVEVLSGMLCTKRARPREAGEGIERTTERGHGRGVSASGARWGGLRRECHCGWRPLALQVARESMPRQHLAAHGWRVAPIITPFEHQSGGPFIDEADGGENWLRKRQRLRMGLRGLE